MSKRLVVVPDVQAPFTNQRQINSLAGFNRAILPDGVPCVGDLFDLPMVSRWTRNRRGEFEGRITDHIDEGCRIIEKLGITDLKEGNHDRRVLTYVEQYAPALSPLAELQPEKLFRLDDLGVVYHRDLWEFTPGWIMAHGDEGNLSQQPGMTAQKLSDKVRKSVVCGHTHRQAILVTGSSFLGVEGPSYTAVEVGHMMNLHDAKYLRSGLANWTAGFAVIDISNKRVAVQLVQMSPTGSFYFEGQAWEDGRIRKKGVDAPKENQAS